MRNKRGWWFPPLSDCRDKWVERFPHTDWAGRPGRLDLWRGRRMRPATLRVTLCNASPGQAIRVNQLKLLAYLACNACRPFGGRIASTRARTHGRAHMAVTSIRETSETRETREQFQMVTESRFVSLVTLPAKVPADFGNAGPLALPDAPHCGEKQETGDRSPGQGGPPLAFRDGAEPDGPPGPSP